MNNHSEKTGVPDSHGKAGTQSNTGRVEELIRHAIHWLPTQGPISVFVHHNTLHALEDLPFELAVTAGAERFGCEPWWSEARYREEVLVGRIRQEDLQETLLEDLGDQADLLVGSFGTRFALRMAMLEFPLQSYPDVELKWLLAETDMLQRFHSGVPAATQRSLVAKTRTWLEEMESAAGSGQSGRESDEALAALVSKRFNGGRQGLLRDFQSARAGAATLQVLWEVVRAGTRDLPVVAANTLRAIRPRDRIHAVSEVDPDLLVHEVLIRFCAAFLDQGLAARRLPGRANGFAKSFVSVLGAGTWPRPDWMRSSAALFCKVLEPDWEPLASILESLEHFRVPPSEQGEFLERTLLALPGWAGMIWQMETNAPWTPRPAPPGSLREFLAVRLILDRCALEHVERLVKRETVRIRAGVSAAARLSLARAFTIFQMAQVRGWQPVQLAAMPVEQWAALVNEMEAFSSRERRRVFHLAYERRFRARVLDALAIHAPQRMAVCEPVRPAWQLITCIDDREESFRRHVEEIDPACETFGAAGFFAVVMYYRGVDQAHFRPLCPINVVPRHQVREVPRFSLRMADQARSRRRRWLGLASRGVNVSSRSLLGGALAGLAGTVATLPLLGRVLAPGWTAWIRASAGELVRPVATELDLARDDGAVAFGDLAQGFTTAEMAGIVVRLLQDIGLVKHFSPVIVLLGHGSNSLNNPHESAYNCGACSGSKGGPNARAFAWMANQPRVRSLVRERGIDLPDEVHFVGGIHDTCTDRIDCFDLDAVPPWHREQLLRIEASLAEACQRNAHERSRRFESVSLDATSTRALVEVRQRAEDLSQVRPEYNHATTAICLVGRRAWSRGLFLDRRAFLVSYDPEVDDPERTILARILAAVIPVCGGISLEYLFSCLDPEGYGCGSKLPHNIVSLAGVMTGAASDLRPGLSQQMTEIHEPMRLLFVVEANPAELDEVVRSNRVTEQMVGHAWVQLATLDPGSGDIRILKRGGSEPWKPRTGELPCAASSREWYRGQRGHLGFAQIGDVVAAGQASKKGCH